MPDIPSNRGHPVPGTGCRVHHETPSSVSGDGAKGASFDFSIASAVETEDTESLTAAYRVLHAENFVAVNGSPKPIELLEAESRKHSARVSEDLKTAVFRAAEILIRGFLEDLQTRPEAFNPKPTLGQLRDTALQTLYRLLFILYAEARDERLQRHRLYQKSYLLEQLADRLLRVPEEDCRAIASAPGRRSRLCSASTTRACRRRPIWRTSRLGADDFLAIKLPKGSSSPN